MIKKINISGFNLFFLEYSKFSILILIALLMIQIQVLYLSYSTYVP